MKNNNNIRGLHVVLGSHPKASIRSLAGRKLVEIYFEERYNGGSDDGFFDRLIRDQNAPEDLRYFAARKKAEIHIKYREFGELVYLSENQEFPEDLRFDVGRALIELAFPENCGELGAAEISQRTIGFNNNGKGVIGSVYAFLLDLIGNEKLPESVRSLAKEKVINIATDYSRRIFDSDTTGTEELSKQVIPENKQEKDV